MNTQEFEACITIGLDKFIERIDMPEGSSFEEAHRQFPGKYLLADKIFVWKRDIKK